MDDLETEALRTIRSARLGDQNALDIVRLVGINASKGDERALATKKVMSDWILANPVPGARAVSSMGAEAKFGCGALMTCAPWQVPGFLAEVDRADGDPALGVGILILSRRALLSAELVKEMAMGLPEEPRKLFWWGVAMCSDRGKASLHLDKQPVSVKCIARAGKAVGTARKIQQVIAGAPISVLDRQAGLEHGEP